jgi:hypothetical protein
MHLPDEEVARRRQQLHEDAYFAVLKAFAKGSVGRVAASPKLMLVFLRWHCLDASPPVPMALLQAPLALTKKLRKELGISDEQHKMWLEDVKAAAAAGNLLYWWVYRAGCIGVGRLPHAWF